MYGSQAGLTVAGVQVWTQDSAGVPNVREPSDRFGSSLAAADFGRSDKADLAIGVPREKIARAPRAGLVNVLYGRSGGLSGPHAQAWSQNSAGIRGSAERYDYFGWSLDSLGRVGRQDHERGHHAVHPVGALDVGQDVAVEGPDAGPVAGR